MDHTELNLVMVGDPANPSIKLSSKPIGRAPDAKDGILLRGIKGVTREARDLVLPSSKEKAPEGELPSDPMSSQPVSP